MLDAETKRRIDTARDVLVGKVPDPKSQVEQITIALIYKFMDDMDASSEELGGTRRFFAGDFARFGWPKLMRSGLGGHEILNLYAEAIDRMQENPGIPQLFRDIFNNAYLPYRDPETLRAFLKIIDEFNYDHSERLGDAFEYLLSVLGSQGDAGQFRTPRHIIDFIVAVVDPKKNETILDPACGTAGFLISSYKQILAANTDDEGNSTLTPDERGRLTSNFNGYDISPDMVRLSLVNMYLHGFQEPHIFEYDTLTSEERWNEYADVILANPPFMSPKGGIRPHNRFSVKSKRSEVLFVDYMAEHLTPSGRAGIIVPEGIIFQSQNAHKQLRKMLVEDYLVAVVSLPAGVFNPYSGVKTSILVLDKALAKRTDRIVFFKVENDGFDLGAQRRPIEKNDLPQIQIAVREYLENVGNMDGQDKQDKSGAPPSPDESVLEQLIQRGAVLHVPRETIATGGEYNLSGERYRETTTTHSIFPLRPLASLLEVQSGFAFKSSKFNESKGFPIIRIRDIKPNNTSTKYDGEFDGKYVVRDGDLIVGMDGEFNSTIWNGGDALLNQRVCRLHSFNGCLKEFIALLIPDVLKEIERGTYAVTVKHISTKQILKIEIPLPSLEEQQEIVAEIDGYQRVIDGARAVINNYKPHIPIDPDWPMVEIGSVIDTITPPHKIQATNFQNEGKYPIIDQSQAEIAGRTDDESALVDGRDGLVIFGDHTCVVKFAVDRFAQGADGIKIITVDDVLLPKFLYHYMLSYPVEKDGYKRHFSKLKRMRVAIPSRVVQQDLVAEIEAEQALVKANLDFVNRMGRKINDAIARVWGD